MAEAMQSVFANPFFINIILPFLLVFVVIYAILAKTKVLDNKGANIIVALVIGFIFVGVPAIVGVTLKIIPIISLIIIIVLCYLILFGFIGIKTEESKALKIILGIVLGLALVATVLWATGVLPKLAGLVKATNMYMVVIVVILIIAIVAVVSSKSQGSSSKT